MDNELLSAISGMFDKKVEEVKNHTGVLIEKLESDIKAIAEGHSILNSKIDTLNEKVDNSTDELKSEMKIIRGYVIGVDTKLNEHEIILKRAK